MSELTSRAMSREDFARRLLQAQRRRKAREGRARERDICDHIVKATQRSVKLRAEGR